MLGKYLSKEESIIRKNILKMGHEASLAIEKAMSCYQSCNSAMADEIITNDRVINELEDRVESECVLLIARQQPVAHDLRELLADMSIAKELERIADYAASIAKLVKKQAKIDPAILPDIMEMSKKCLFMLSQILIAYAEKDADKANTIALLDNELDEMENTLNERIFELMLINSEDSISYTYQLWIVHQLERVADRVTNIAESVIFLSTGEVVNYS